MNLALSLLYAAERWPDAEAVVEGDERPTYVELRARAARVAGALAVEPGDRVAAVVKNRLDAVVLYWACQWAGATYVPLSWRVSTEDVEYCREDCGAARFFEVDAALPEGDEHPGALDRDEREESLMLYTSGTTGRPKGVPRSHRADRAAGLSQVIHHGYGLGDRTLAAMPLYHTMGMHSLLAMSLVGGCLVMQPAWETEQALRLIDSERITSLYLAPTLFHDLVHHPNRAEYDLSSVRAVAYAGAAMTSALVERVGACFEPEVFTNHYGSTEIYTFSFSREQRRKPGCAGRPALNARLRLIRPDADATPSDVVAAGEDGQIICDLSSDEAFAGYWQRPNADEKALHEGWYYTGDLGRVDEEGDLWIVGRVDDMIISGGENIHPLEVEDVLARHPAVREVAVIGWPDERLGQRVVAYVVCEGNISADELDEFCLGSTLARYKRPREYRFVDALPKSPAGKVLRRLLREEVRV